MVAVVGDAGLTTGLTLEGINNLGTLKKKVLVILNDNKMSISPNVGALAGYLNRIVHGQAYHRLREEVEKMIRCRPAPGTPPAQDLPGPGGNRQEHVDSGAGV